MLSPPPPADPKSCWSILSAFLTLSDTIADEVEEALGPRSDPKLSREAAVPPRLPLPLEASEMDWYLRKSSKGLWWRIKVKAKEIKKANRNVYLLVVTESEALDIGPVPFGVVVVVKTRHQTLGTAGKTKAEGSLSDALKRHCAVVVEDFLFLLVLQTRSSTDKE